MKIILAITDEQNRESVFITDRYEVLSLEEAISLAKQKKIDDIHVVQRNSKFYLRTNRNVPKERELDQLSIKGNIFYEYWQGYRSLENPVLIEYINRYLKSIENDQSYVKLVGWFKSLKIPVQNGLKKNKEYIFEAALRFNIDPYLLGAILVDEIARRNPVEEIADKVFNYVKNTSIGIAQVTAKNANYLLKRGLYNPTREHLYKYLIEPKHNIYIGAALIRSIIDDWKPFIDLKNKPDILATLYSLGRSPHGDPKSNERGSQIADEFYQLVKDYLQ